MQPRRSGCGLVLLIVGVIVLGLMVANTLMKPATSSTGGSSPTGASATDPPQVPLYLGVPGTNAAARMGTPTMPLGGGTDGYGICLNYPNLDMWKVSTDATTGRVNYVGPRDGCTNDAPAWRDWSRQELPPDAQFIGETTDARGGPLLTYHSDWLANRLGCGTIKIRGNDASNGWDAEVNCTQF